MQNILFVLLNYNCETLECRKLLVNPSSRSSRIYLSISKGPHECILEFFLSIVDENNYFIIILLKKKSYFMILTLGRDP